MRRGRATVAAALPTRSLRPLLFLLVSLFLVLPMLVYNVSTLDYSRLPKWSEAIGDPTGMRGALAAGRSIDGNEATYDEATAIGSLPVALKDCSAAGLRDVRRKYDVATLRERCFDSDNSANTNTPSTVHFVYLPVHLIPLLEGEQHPPAENFTMIQFAAMQSVRKHVKPKIMVMHYPETPPRSFWYTQCQRHLSLHRVLLPKLPSVKKSSLSVYQRRDIMQLLLALRALRKQGGIAFVDFNTFLLRPLSPLLQLPFSAGRARSNSFSVSPAVLSSSPGNAYVASLEATLQQMLEADDERLHTTPLARLVGDLLAAMYESKSVAVPNAKPNALFTNPSLLDAVPSTQLKAFLNAKLTKPAMDLREAMAFRLPPASPVEQKSSVGNGIAALRLVETRTHDFESLSDDRTLFGGILRYSISLNETAELDAVLL